MSGSHDRSAGIAARSRAAAAVLSVVLAVTAVSLVGGVISVSAGLSPTFLDAVGPDGHLSVPLPMTAFQILTALAAGSRRRPVALLGSGLLCVAVTVAVASGFFDGGYADDRLDAAQRVYQLVLVLALCAVVVLAATRFVEVWRSRPAEPVGT